MNYIGKDTMRFDKDKYEEYIKYHPLGKRIPADSTIRQYGSQVNKFLRENKNFFDKKFQEQKEILRKNILNKRVVNRKSALLYFLKYKNKNKLVEFLNELNVSEKGRRYEGQFLGLNEVKKLVSELENKKLSLLVKIAFETASRVRALLKLKLNNLRKDSGEGYYLLLREKGAKKSKKYIKKETAEELKKIARDEDTRIFQIDKNYSIDKDYQKYYSILKEQSKKILGSEYGISFHWLRRSRAVYLREKKKADFETIRNLLDHEDLGTTKRYIKKELGEDSKEVIKSDDFDWN